METNVQRLVTRFLEDSLSFKEIETRYEAHKENPEYVEALKIVFDQKEYDPSTSKDIKDYQKDYVSYPDPKQADFYECVEAKQEFGMYRIDAKLKEFKEACSRDFFELAPHQLFLKNWMSPNTPYKSLLVFHGVGVGKTCSGISMAENFKDVYGKKEKRIIILAAGPIQQGWKKTIYNPEGGSHQCTADTYNIDRGEPLTLKKRDTKAKQIVKTYYELSAYTAFANRVKRLLETRLQSFKHATPEEIETEEKRIIREEFSNRMLIIDEVHNIRSNDDETTRDTITYIMKVIKYSDNLRLVLLTANPMFNQPDEIVWIINMLLANENHSLISQSIFTNGVLTPEGEQILRNVCRGYVSYMRGENPVSFPLRLYPEGPMMLTKDMSYTSSYVNGTTESLQFLELYSTYLKHHQKKVYKRALATLDTTDTFTFEEETQLLQIGDIVFPHTNPDDELQEYYGSRGFDRCFTHNKGVYTYQPEILENFGKFLHVSELPKYSCKFASMIREIHKSEGMVFIYTNWIKGCLIPLSLMLEQNGYLPYNSKPTLSETPDTRHGSYIAITPDKMGSHQQLQTLLSVATSTDNADGSTIKIIIGSSVAAEGLDFKHIRAIHILEPWRNLNKLEQVIGRGVRNCSHKALSPEKRNATVYLHNAMFHHTDMNVGTLDTYLYRYSEDKARHIGNVETILKEVAIDKCLFEKMNMLLRKSSVTPIKVQRPIRNTDMFTVYPYDKPNSRVCSFQPHCNYVSHECNIRKGVFNTDTMRIEYSSGLLQVYKKRIAYLFEDYMSYKYEDLLHQLQEYTDVYEVFVRHALDQMIQEQYMIVNSQAHTGYIICINDTFIFQPDHSNDMYVPYYYRCQKGPSYTNILQIQPREKIKVDVSSEMMKFTLSDITTLYESIIDQDFKTQSEADYIAKQFHITQASIWGYIIDRCSFMETIKLLYSVLCIRHWSSFKVYYETYHRDEEPLLLQQQLTMEQYEDLYQFLESHTMSQIIYYDSKNEIYTNKPSSKYDLYGFYVYHSRNKRPYIYQWKDGAICLANKVDEYDILDSLTTHKQVSSPKGDIWGFMIYASRFEGKSNGLVAKIVDPRDKQKSNYVYPPGPGVVIVNSQDSSRVPTFASQPVQFIKDEFSEVWNRATPATQDTIETVILQEKKKGSERVSIKHKTYTLRERLLYATLIECCIREKHHMLSQGSAWLLYHS